jgi:signal transduction histidine kinase
MSHRWHVFNGGVEVQVESGAGGVQEAQLVALTAQHDAQEAQRDARAAQWDAEEAQHEAQGAQRDARKALLEAPETPPEAREAQDAASVAQQGAFHAQQEALGAQLAALEAQLHAREAQLDAQELFQGERAGKQAHHDQMLSILGRELRNPLTSILLALELMKRKAVGADSERGVIERQVRQLMRLIEDLPRACGGPPATSTA